MMIWTDPENWWPNLNEVRLRFLANLRTFNSLHWTTSHLHGDVSTMKTHVENLREVVGDAYARSRTKEEVSVPVIRKVNTLERDLQALSNEVRQLRAYAQEIDSELNSIRSQVLP